MCNDRFLEEMEVLQAIYEDEIIIVDSDEESAEIKITIHPNTADDEDGKFVCLTLHFNFTFSSKSMNNYPDKAPHMAIKNPRGLADSHLASIEENLKSLAVSSVGEQMLYTLIEYAKDSLTDNNHPSCDCPICLDKFVGNDVFFRTPCYHYFHKTCMKEYLDLALEQTVCPVCRLQFQVDPGIFHSIIINQKSSATDVETFVPNQIYKDWRAKCDALFQKQKRNGGIIDVEYEKTKYLLKTSQPRLLEDTETPLLEMTNLNLNVNVNTLATAEEKEFHGNTPSSSGAKDYKLQPKVRSGERYQDRNYPTRDYRRDVKSESNYDRTDRKHDNYKHKKSEKKDEPRKNLAGTSNVDRNYQQKPANRRKPRDRCEKQADKGDKPSHTAKLPKSCSGGGEGKITESKLSLDSPRSDNSSREEKSTCLNKGSLKSKSQSTDLFRPPPGLEQSSSNVRGAPPGFVPRLGPPPGLEQSSSNVQRAPPGFAPKLDESKGE